MAGAGIPPGAEHGVARLRELILGVLRERLAGLLLNQLLVVFDDDLQILGGQVGIELRLHLLLASVEEVLELILRDFENDVAEHLDEAAVAVVCEPRIAALGHQRLDRLVVQAQIQNGIHHARHGELGAGTHADQQRVLRVAELLAHAALEDAKRLVDLRVDVGRDLTVVVEVDVADFGRNRKTRGDRNAGPAHLSQARALAAKGVFHLSIAVGSAGAEGVDVFLHNAPVLLEVIKLSKPTRDDLRKIGDRRKLCK